MLAQSALARPHSCEPNRDMKLFCIVTILVLTSGVAFPQTPRVELGVQVGGIRENALGEYPVSSGGRFTVHLFQYIDGEAEVNRFPIGGGIALFPATEATFGARIGRRFGLIGFYGKVRSGFIRFDSNSFAPTLRTRPALDFGGVLEFYSRRHIAGRFDFGDTAVWYGRDVLIPQLSKPGSNIAPGTRHQLQFSFGVSAWF
jgi:hypothetical protein